MKTRTLIALLLVLGLPLCFAAWAAWERSHHGVPMEIPELRPPGWDAMRRHRMLMPAPGDAMGD